MSGDGIARFADNDSVVPCHCEERAAYVGPGDVAVSATRDLTAAFDFTRHLALTYQAYQWIGLERRHKV